MQQSCWIATDGKAGNEKQCLALAHYLGLPAEVFRLTLRTPWEQLAPRFRWMSGLAFRGDFAARLAGPLPDLFIGCGRRAALAGLALGQRGTVRTIQILNPRIEPGLYDWVICPEHDRLTGPGVIQTVGALHQVDDDWLGQARESWRHLAELPGPRIGVLVGGPARSMPMGPDSVKHLLNAARNLAGAGSVLVTTSGRTPRELLPLIKRELADTPGLAWTGPGDGANPYPGLVAWSDRLVVSPDSVSMISEALGTGRPVHCQPPASITGRLAEFHRMLADRGLVLALDDQTEPSYSPLREARRVAELIGQQLGVA